MNVSVIWVEFGECGLSLLPAVSAELAQVGARGST